MNSDSTFPKSNAPAAAAERTAEFRAIEFFAGVGGFAMAWPEVDVAAAIDIHQGAAQVYRANFHHSFWVREIESIPTEEILELQANLWWMSPPCQPYTQRGERRDVADRRSLSLVRLIAAIAPCLPELLVLENVRGFANSIAMQRLSEQLTRCGYRWQSLELCPTQMGWPNKRPRFYLIASRGAEVAPWSGLPEYACQAAQLVDGQDAALDAKGELAMDVAVIAEIEAGIDRYSPDADRPTACFASSYGRALLNSGSYLCMSDGRYRRFSPQEVANFLGYPAQFQLPVSCSTRTLWKLLGNSLSLPAVRYVLSHLPGGPSPKLPWR